MSCLSVAVPRLPTSFQHLSLRSICVDRSRYAGSSLGADARSAATFSHAGLAAPRGRKVLLARADCGATEAVSAVIRSAAVSGAMTIVPSTHQFPAASAVLSQAAGLVALEAVKAGVGGASALLASCSFVGLTGPYAFGPAFLVGAVVGTCVPSHNLLHMAETGFVAAGITIGCATSGAVLGVIRNSFEQRPSYRTQAECYALGCAVGTVAAVAYAVANCR